MKREIIITKDGSSSIAIPELQVTYHSIHGAIQESKHVFIEAGFNRVTQQELNQISILEVGFGTGLNALLTAIEAQKNGSSIYYVALEPDPISVEEAESLNYCELLERQDLIVDFKNIHICPWNRSIAFAEEILMHKSGNTLQNFVHQTKFNLIYYDAFAPAAQPELWTKEVFEKLYDLTEAKGILVTYCSKGDVRRAIQAAGFQIEKIPGPPGKREMIRATKL